MSRKQTRIDSKFGDFLDSIKRERMLNGINKKTRLEGDEKITKEMMSTKAIKQMRKELLIDKKKLFFDRMGAATDLFIVIVVGFILLLFILAWMIGWGMLTDAITGITSQTNEPVNVSQAGEDVFGQVNTGLGVWYWAVGAIVLALFISVFVSNFLIKSHPVFIVPYILIVIVAVIFSVVISNAYESAVLGNSLFGAEASNFGGSNFIFLNLPIWTTVLGMLGGVFLFIGIIRDKGAGETLSV